MSQTHPIDYIIGERITRKLKESLRITEVAREYGIAYSFISMVQADFQRPENFSRNIKGGRPCCIIKESETYITITTIYLRYYV